MAIALVAHTANDSPGNNVTTSPIDTTGANFIAITISWYSLTAPSIAISDSKGNSYTGLTIYGGGTDAACQIFYCSPLTVGAGHTFTSLGSGGGSTFATLCVSAFSGMSASSVFQTGTDSGATSSSSTTIQPGSITPSGSSLIITTVGVESTGTGSINLGFTITDQIGYAAGNNIGGASAYLIQTSGSVINPTWTMGSGVLAITAAIAAFKGAASTTLRLLPLTGVGT